MKVSISLPEELVTYVDEKVKNRNQLIESLLQQWWKKQQEQEMVEACLLLDEMNLEWNDEWNKQRLPIGKHLTNRILPINRNKNSQNSPFCDRCRNSF